MPVPGCGVSDSRRERVLSRLRLIYDAGYAVQVRAVVSRAALLAADEDSRQAHRFRAPHVRREAVAHHPGGLGASDRLEHAVEGPRVRLLVAAFGGVEDFEQLFGDAEVVEDLGQFRDVVREDQVRPAPRG